MKRVGTLIKIAISGLLAWLVLTHVDYTAADVLLRGGQAAATLVLVIMALAGQAVIAGTRTAWVMRLLDARCSIGRSIAVWMVGLLLSQSLISFIAGDAARVWQFVRLRYSARAASSACPNE